MLCKSILNLFISCSFGASMGIYSMTLLLILLGRAAFVFPLSAFSNYMNRRAVRRCSLSIKQQVSIFHLANNLFRHLIRKIIFSRLLLNLMFNAGNHMVGWANERSCLHCFGFQTGMWTSFYYTVILECD